MLLVFLLVVWVYKASSSRIESLGQFVFLQYGISKKLARFSFFYIRVLGCSIRVIVVGKAAIVNVLLIRTLFTHERTIQALYRKAMFSLYNWRDTCLVGFSTADYQRVLRGSPCLRQPLRY